MLESWAGGVGQAATERKPTLSTSISRHLRKGGHVIFRIIAAGGPSRLCRLSDVLQAAGNGVRSGFILGFGGLGVLGEEPLVFLEREHHFGWLVFFDVRVRIHKIMSWRCSLGVLFTCTQLRWPVRSHQDGGRLSGARQQAARLFTLLITGKHGG